MWMKDLSMLLLNMNVRFQPNISDCCHDLLLKAMSFNITMVYTE